MYNSIITYIVFHCSAHWQMILILPKESVVIWFCLLHNRPENYLKGIINRSVLFFNTFALALVGNINILIVQYTSMFVFNNALKGLDDTPQSKSKATTRWIVVKVSYFTIRKYVFYIGYLWLSTSDFNRCWKYWCWKYYH